MDNIIPYTLSDELYNRNLEFKDNKDKNNASRPDATPIQFSAFR